VLELVGDLVGVLDLNEFCEQLLRALLRAVPSEWCAMHEVPADLPATISLSYPVLGREVHEEFARYADQNPIASYFIRTRDGRATRFSDLITRRELHELELYQRVYQQLGVEYQMAFTLPSGAERILGVALSRERRDFSARERDLLNRARPYLIQMYRNALHHSLRTERGGTDRLPVELVKLLGLTRRQAEILRLTAMGYAAEDVAASLAISVRTVQKHLQNIYRTLGVANRSEAAQAAWRVVGGAVPAAEAGG
jgi:DNA-binding CsgD family transcriptional regulator